MWIGLIARAMPSWPAPARRVHSAFVSRASVATTASVVFSVGGVNFSWRNAATSRRDRPAQLGELVTDPVAGAPQLAGRRVHRAAPGVDDDERGDGDAFGRDDAGRTDAALQRRGVGAGAGTDRALADRPRARGGGGPPAELGVRPVAEDAARAEVEDDRRRDDRHDVVRLQADLEPAAALLEPGHHAAGRVEAVRAAAGEADAVDLADHVQRVQRVGLPSSGSAAAHVDAADRARRRQHDRRAGQPAPAGALVVADLEPGDVREVVAGADPHDARRRNRSAAST